MFWAYFLFGVMFAVLIIGLRVFIRRKREERFFKKLEKTLDRVKK